MRTNGTLVELIVKNFRGMGSKNQRGRKKGKNKGNQNAVSRHKSSIAAIVSRIMLNSTLEGGEKGKKQVAGGVENAARESKEEEKELPGGYGTIRHYAGMSPNAKYADYDKIWSHMGAFNSNSAYGGKLGDVQRIAADNGESSRQMVSYDAINKAERHFKYFVIGELMGEVGLVPPVGIGVDSGEWEKYRLMTLMSVYRPLLKLMRSMA